MANNEDQTEDKNAPVQPLESKDEAPKEDKKAKPTGEVCWNCLAQDPETTNLLDKKGNCSVCGFSKNSSEFVNGNLEADKAAQRVEAARQAEQQ